MLRELVNSCAANTVGFVLSRGRWLVRSKLFIQHAETRDGMFYSPSTIHDRFDRCLKISPNKACSHCYVARCTASRFTKSNFRPLSTVQPSNKSRWKAVSLLVNVQCNMSLLRRPGPESRPHLIDTHQQMNETLAYFIREILLIYCGRGPPT